MTYDEFAINISKVGMRIIHHQAGLWSIGSKEFANPILFFNPSESKEDYMGHVYVKSVNSRLYSAENIKYVLTQVDELLMTELDERGNKFEFPSFT